MFRSFTSRGNHRWVDILKDLVDGYNNTKHSSTGFKPNEVNEENENEVKRNLYPKINRKKQHTKVVF